MSKPVTTHVGVTGRVVNQPIRRGTGLHDESINGRPATTDEQEARQRAYQQQREADSQLVNVRPWQPGDSSDKWAAVEQALAAVARG